MGWSYNIVDPNLLSSTPVIIGVGIFFTILSFSILVLRLYVRKHIIKAISIDDWFAIATWLFSLVYFSMITTQTRWGLGIQAVEAVPPQNLEAFEMLQYACGPFYIGAILGFKLSVLFCFLRMAVGRTYRVTIICTSIACCLFHFCYFVAQLSLCKPVAQLVEDTTGTETSMSAVTFHAVMASITFVFDISTMLVPIPILLYSCFSMRKNIMIGILFILGSFISFIQILRITAYSSRSSYLTTSSTSATWSLIEINLGIIICSLIPIASHPRLRSFLEKGPPRSLASFDSRRTMEQIKVGMRRKFGRGSPFRNRVLLFLGYGELRPDLAREQAPGNRLGASSEELHLHFPMEILKTTEVIVSREGSSWGEIKEYEV